MKLKILSFDGEMLPQNNQMPNPEKCPIMLISFAANYDIMNGKKKVIFVLNRDKNLPEGIVVRDEFNDVIVRFNDERRLIHGWELLIKDCDTIIGYNIAGFDIPYIVDRAKALNMSKLVVGNADDTLWHKKHDSKGKSVTVIGGIKGKIVEDVLYILRRDDASNTIKADYNLKNLKLEVTAKEILGKEKKEFSSQEMIDYWEHGTNEDKFIEYCSVDSELALEFITKFRLLDKFIGLSRRAGKVPQDIIDSQGFGSLVENLLMKEFGKNSRVVPCRGKSSSSVDDELDKDNELKGAFVKEPKVGISDHVIIADYACCVGDTLVLTNKGLIKIREIENIKNNGIIFTNSFKDGEFSNKEIIDFKKIGIENTKKVTLENGYEIEGSTNHRILTVKDGNASFTELKDLKINDVVVLNKGSNTYGNDVVFDYSSHDLLDTIQKGQYGGIRYITLKNVHDRLFSDIYIPDRVTPEFAEFFGYMVSDGYVTDKHVNMGFTQKDTKVFERFVYLYDTVFKRKNVGKNLSLLDYFNDSKIEFKNIKNDKLKMDYDESNDIVNKLKNNPTGGYELQYRYKGGHEATISSVDLKRLFKHYGFTGNSYEKEVPWCILQSSKRCQCAFLMTLFEGDGCANKLDYNKRFNNRRINYLSKSKKLCYQIQTMLLNMGIISDLDYIEGSNDYKIQMTGYNCVLYYENIGFVSERKILRTNNIVNSVMGYDYTDIKNEMEIDLDKISKKDKTGNRFPIEVNLNVVLKRLHSKYVNLGHYGYKKLSHNVKANYVSNRDDPSFYRRIYKYINDNENINIMILRKYLKMAESELRDDIDYMKLKWFAECNMIFLRVQKIEDSANTLYDISIDVTHNYVSNGFISHNSLYPSLIIKHNMCYTTVILDNTIPDDPESMNIIRDEDGKLLGRFVKPHILKGIVPSILESLTTERKTAKNEMKKYEKGSSNYLTWDSEQNATKILMNTFFGYTGEDGAKLYCFQVASSITGSGQKQIKYTMKMIDGITVTDIDGKLYELLIIMGDTDSIYVQIIPLDIINSTLNREIAVRCVSQELEKINVTLEKPMKLAFEDYAKRVLVTAKKRYTKIIVDENGKERVASKGIETIRREWSDFASESLEKAINIVLFEEKVDVGIKKLINFTRNEAEKLKKGEIDIHKLIRSNQLTKPITNYDNDTPHVKVAILMKERGRPSEVGDRIQYFIMNNGKKLISDRAEEADYVLSGKCKYKIDYDYYITKQLFPPVIRILKTLGVSEKLLTVDKKQKTMMDF